ncbi:MAG: SGNH/GDSL hydrolase family protein [Acidobacteria bacterium]|nr:SGNH/GDSL hydrolase family protein [Acidobacteriota bacterium]
MTAQTSRCRISLPRLALVVAQLALLVFIMRQFQIESSAFLRVVLLAFGGFVVHSFLPFRYRLPFFLGLSLGAIWIVFGTANGIWLVGIGLALIGLCHLPVPFSIRVLLLLSVGLLLATFRVDWLSSPFPSAVWPILGSMFMFRLIVYLYDLHHDKGPVSWTRTLAYFFLLPNACFPLFPVVDYKTFRRTYYDDNAYKIYQLGIDWMLRGAIQLILYRYVYHYLTLGTPEVKDTATLVQYAVSTFLLYLRVSGQFHLVVGMLQLFGFHLPETHHRYFLAASFTDFWRRINIYWKDFMLKVFYYPVYFKLRKLGTTQAMIISTILVFVTTWFLHAYQWFWLRGSFLLTTPDVLFWTILGILVVINALWEERRGRKRSLTKSAWDSRQVASVSLSTVLTFTTICILWSLWTSESLTAWVSLWSFADEKPVTDSGLMPWVLVGAVVLNRTAPSLGKAGAHEKEARFFQRFPAETLASLVLLSLLGIQEIYTKLGPQAATLVNSLRSGKLSRLDNAKLERGYYEQLMQVDRFNSQLWEVYTKKPINWLDVQGTGLEKFTGDFMQKELLPSFVAVTSYGPVRTNRWGMRDKDYEKEPRPGSFRMALLGASSVMGWGVRDSETFETLLEERLNGEDMAVGYSRYEILNFAVPGYQPLQQLPALEKAFTFRPNAVLYVAASREAHRCSLYLAEVVRKAIPIPYDYMRETAQKAEIDAKTPESIALRRLLPFRDEMLSWLYRRIVQACREQGVVPVWIFLPMILEDPWQDDTASLLQAAHDAGFVVINLVDVFRNQDLKALRLAEWDTHPNVRAHQLIASSLYSAIGEKRDNIFLARLAR